MCVCVYVCLCVVKASPSGHGLSGCSQPKAEPACASVFSRLVLLADESPSEERGRIALSRLCRQQLHRRQRGTAENQEKCPSPSLRRTEKSRRPLPVGNQSFCRSALRFALCTAWERRLSAESSAALNTRRALAGSLSRTHTHAHRTDCAGEAQRQRLPNRRPTP